MLDRLLQSKNGKDNINDNAKNEDEDDEDGDGFYPRSFMN